MCVPSRVVAVLADGSVVRYRANNTGGGPLWLAMSLPQYACNVACVSVCVYWLCRCACGRVRLMANACMLVAWSALEDDT